jgi:hypothetical protein
MKARAMMSSSEGTKSSESNLFVNRIMSFFDGNHRLSFRSDKAEGFGQQEIKASLLTQNLLTKM